jgi:hypothetical protein
MAPSQLAKRTFDCNVQGGWNKLMESRLDRRLAENLNKNSKCLQPILWVLGRYEFACDLA